MNAPPKGQMPGRRASHVQPVRVGKDMRVSVGRPQEAEHPLSGNYSPSTQLNQLTGYPAVHLHRTIETQKFIDRSLQQRRVFAQLRSSLR